MRWDIIAKVNSLLLDMQWGYFYATLFLWFFILIFYVAGYIHICIFYDKITL